MLRNRARCGSLSRCVVGEAVLAIMQEALGWGDDQQIDRLAD